MKEINHSEFEPAAPLSDEQADVLREYDNEKTPLLATLEAFDSSRTWLYEAIDRAANGQRLLGSEVVGVSADLNQTIHNFDALAEQMILAFDDDTGLTLVIQLMNSDDDFRSQFLERHVTAAERAEHLEKRHSERMHALVDEREACRVEEIPEYSFEHTRRLRAVLKEHYQKALEKDIFLATEIRFLKPGD